MPKVSSEHAEARRQRIIDAAVECFTRDGFHQATTQDIVRESGLSLGSIYLYFKSKEEIIEAVAAQRHAREREWILAASQQSDIRAILHTLVHSAAKALSDPAERKGHRLGIQMWAEALRNPPILDSVRSGVDVPRQVLTKALRAARRRGEVRDDLDPAATALMMICLFQGFVLQLAWNDALPVGPYIRTVEKLLAAMLIEPGER